MKLRYKIPLLLLVVMSSIVLVAFVCFRYYFVPHFFESNRHLDRLAVQKEQDIVNKLRQSYPDVSQMIAHLKNEPRSGNISLSSIQGDKRTEIFSYEAAKKNEVAFHFHKSIVMNDRSVYELDIDYPLSWQDFNVDNLRGQVYLALILLLIAAVLLLALFFHLFIAKSLYDLNRLVEGISIRSPALLRSLPRRRDEIGELYVGFSRMAVRLRQAHEEQVEMIAAITHDLKTPLTVIRGCNERVRTQSEADRAESDQLIHRKIIEMSSLLNDFSAFGSNELEMHTSEFAPVPIRPFFESVAREYENELDGFGYRLVWSHNLPDMRISMNEKMIRRVFANLISNAVRYRKDDSLKVTLEAVIKKKEVEFVVGDNGEGLSKEEWTAIFKRFYRVEKSRQRQHGGTGLGLAICRTIVERHGGTIIANRSSLGGLEIRFTIEMIK
ncbi:sensor histidine kinase [Cohnella silvisoli]|uniref:histidine kinase n=1 Tax=Cohnella silvisoli TaxID=2873699 RepID=A0ABV1L677_9BACL|nr:HAMP domain-containing sensor histidine kinase [Cohnella silvisoli]MCD9026344.1 HAMP domain-containing histidine kinase [Cohnella silvisoli]